MSKRKTKAMTEEENKRYRSALDDCADEFICAITCELPVEPVMAEDGHIYEKAAIEQWLRNNNKSPKNNEAMGKRLVPAVGVRNTIEKMVRTGALTGDKATEWQRKIEEKDEVTETHRKAEGGDVEAILRLATSYKSGKNGVEKDESRAFRYFKQAADLGNMRGLCHVGTFYALGWGVEKNLSEAMIATARAAEGGSNLACFNLGLYYSVGRFNLPKDVKQAVMWFKKVPGCSIRHLHKDDALKAAAYVREHDTAV